MMMMMRGRRAAHLDSQNLLQAGKAVSTSSCLTENRQTIPLETRQAECLEWRKSEDRRPHLAHVA